MTRTTTPRAPGRPRSGPGPQLVVSHAKTTEGEEGAAPEEDVPAGPPPADALSEMMAGLQGANNSRITIYRIVKNQPPSYVAECDPASFSMDDLREKYRGGEFRLYVMKDGRLWKNMRVFIEPPPHQPMEAAPAASHIGDMLTVMREGFAAQASLLREAVGARPAPTSLFANADLPAIITAISGAIVALRPPAPALPPVVDTSKSAIDMFIQGITLAKELREDSSPQDNSIGGMLRTVLQSPLMAQAVQAATAPPAAPQRPAPQKQQALPNPQPTQPQSQPQPTQPEGSDVNMLHYYYGLLCQKAASGADPVLYAEIVLDNVDDDTLNTLLAKQPTPLDALIAEYPPAEPHRAWFATLIDTLMGAMTEEVTNDDAPTVTTVVANGAPSDAPHAQSPIVPGQPS